MNCCDAEACSEGDLVKSRVAWLIWCLPAALVVAGVFSSHARAALWIPSFLVMGAACVFNAKRCGRLHCHITGPIFLIAAAVTLLDALEIVSIAWLWILIASAAGTVLGYGLEHLRGLYVSR